MDAREQTMPDTASPPLIDGFDSRVAEVNGVRLHYTGSAAILRDSRSSCGTASSRPAMPGGTSPPR